MAKATTAHDLEPKAGDQEPGPVNEHKNERGPNVNPSEVSQHGDTRSFRASRQPTQAGVIADYNAAIDAIAAATKKLSDAGMNGTEAGKIAAAIYMRNRLD